MRFIIQGKLGVVLILLSSLACFSQQLPADSCHQFVKGSFIIEGREHIRIRRRPHRQIEKDTRNKITWRYKLKWVDECAYTLILIRTSDKDRIARDKIGASQPHVITNTNGTRYTYTTSFSFLSADQCGTLTRFERKEETLIKVR
ncbi:MAG TPA: hypothetical protein VD927_14500 [Chryseosolibacter sp.]|nr:hypothetical protein [Chryseosolibacter sp.]